MWNSFLLEAAFAGKYLHREDLSRKGAKAQRRKALRVSKGFLCAFAPLREKYFFPPPACRRKP